MTTIYITRSIFAKSIRLSNLVDLNDFFGIYYILSNRLESNAIIFSEKEIKSKQYII